MRRVVVLAALAALAAAAPADAAVVPVDIQFQLFAPSQLEVLPGETVQWTNIGGRRHTVTADDESFDSGDLFGGDRFDMTFAAVGAHPYHCRVHPGMDGEVDVRPVTLGTLPTDLVPVGTPVEMDGRTADAASPVRIERDTGRGFETVASVTPDSNGSWNATVPAERTAFYRAAVNGGTSGVRRLLVSDRRVVVRSRPGRVTVRVVPPKPYGWIALELRLRDRFGWWPAQQRRLDYLSEAVFRVNRRVRARVALVDKDRWTPLATSRTLGLRGRKK